MTRWALLALLLTAPAATPSALAQGADADNGQLGFYLGRWSEEGQSRSTPSGGFSKMTGEESCSWFSGGPTVVCRETTKDANSEADHLYILSYDPARKNYSMHGTDNLGTIYSGSGVIDASGVWRWTADARRNGASTPMRFTFKAAGNGSRTMEIEMSTGKGTWVRLSTVTYTRAR